MANEVNGDRLLDRVVASALALKGRRRRCILHVVGPADL